MGRALVAMIALALVGCATPVGTTSKKPAITKASKAPLPTKTQDPSGTSLTVDGKSLALSGPLGASFEGGFAILRMDAKAGKFNMTIGFSSKNGLSKGFSASDVSELSLSILEVDGDGSGLNYGEGKLKLPDSRVSLTFSDTNEKVAGYLEFKNLLENNDKTAARSGNAKIEFLGEFK